MAQFKPETPGFGSITVGRAVEPCLGTSIGRMDETKKLRITVLCISTLVILGFAFFLSGGLGLLFDP